MIEMRAHPSGQPENSNQDQGLAPTNEQERLTSVDGQRSITELSATQMTLDPRKRVTLICFGSSSSVRDNLELAVTTVDWREITHDPVILYDIIFTDLYARIVIKMSGLIQVYRGVRQVCPSITTALR